MHPIIEALFLVLIGGEVVTPPEPGDGMEETFGGLPLTFGALPQTFGEE